MAANTSVCGLCDLRHVSTPSTVWCQECEEALCVDCKEHHSLSKASRGHTTILISDYHKLPSFIFISEIQQYCHEHNDRYQLFCQTHSRPLCHRCVKDHVKCGDVVSLNDIIANAKTSVALQDLKQTLEDLLSNIEKMKKDRKNNLRSIGDQKTSWIRKIHDFRRKVNQHLDTLEDQMCKELDNAEENAKKQIKSAIDTLDDKEKDVSKSQITVKYIQQYASDLQAFLGTRQIERNVDDSENCLQSLISSNAFKQISIACKFDTAVNEVLTVVEQLGTVQLQSSPGSMVTSKTKDKQAQIMRTREVRSVQSISLKLKQKMKLDGVHSIRGCYITSDDEVLFTDHYFSKSLLIMKLNGTTKFTMNLRPSAAYDIATINKDTVAVTSGSTSNKMCVDIVDLNKRKVTKSINLPGQPYGITNNGTSLICCVMDKDIHVISCTDYSISTIPNTTLPRYGNVTAYVDKIYYTNSEEYTANCCYLDGTPVWHFKETSILKKPRGVAVDNHGNVYIAGMWTSNVLVISPDGKQYKQILGKGDGLNKPTALFYDRTGNQLLVANTSDGSAFLFSVL